MKKLKSNPKLFFVMVGVCIIFILFYAFFLRSSNAYDYLKIDKSQSFVYTISEEEKGYYYQYMPFINLKGDVGTYVNQDIASFYQNFNQDDICITYDSNLNGKVLSLIIKVEDYSYAESAAIYYFKSYNINLEREELVDDNTLFGYFNLTSDSVQTILNQKIEEYYQELVDDKSINKSCNYQCFFKERQFEDGLSDVAFYVREGKLIAYKPYINIGETDEDLMIHEFEITN